jgi:hypothetical protein
LSSAETNVRRVPNWAKENTKVRIPNRVGICVGIFVALILLSPSIKAQGVGFKPGQTVTIDLAFHGKDASEIPPARTRWFPTSMD